MKEDNFIKFGGNAVIESITDDQLGTRGKQLAELASLKAHISLGFIVSNDSISDLVSINHGALEETMSAAINHVESGMKQRFGGEDDPLLLKVVENSMLSFVDTVPSMHHIGLNDTTIDGFAKALVKSLHGMNMDI